MSMFTMRQLLKTSAYIAVGGLTAVLVMRQSLIDRVRKTDYYKQSFKILRAHEGAKVLLGEPIKEGGLDIGDPNYCNHEKAYFEVKVKGSNNSGVMYFWAKNPENSAWAVERIELEINGDNEKRLLIHKSSQNFSDSN